MPDTELIIILVAFIFISIISYLIYRLSTNKNLNDSVKAVLSNPQSHIPFDSVSQQLYNKKNPGLTVLFIINTTLYFILLLGLSTFTLLTDVVIPDYVIAIAFFVLLFILCLIIVKFRDRLPRTNHKGCYYVKAYICRSTVTINSTPTALGYSLLPHKRFITLCYYDPRLRRFKLKTFNRLKCLTNNTEYAVGNYLDIKMVDTGRRFKFDNLRGEGCI